MHDPTPESSVHRRDETPSTRWLAHVFIALLPVLACFLGGATAKWAEGIVVALLGVFLIARPPRFSLGPAINLTLLALLMCVALAFLPANWFFQSQWRATYLTDFAIKLPTTVSPQPWITLTCFFSLLAGISWFYVVCAQQLELREARVQMRLFTAGLVALATICILFWLAKSAPPFWHNERNFVPVVAIDCAASFRRPNARALSPSQSRQCRHLERFPLANFFRRLSTDPRFALGRNRAWQFRKRLCDFSRCVLQRPARDPSRKR